MTSEQPSELLIKDELNQKFHAACWKKKKKKRFLFTALTLISHYSVDNRQHLYASVNSQMLCPYLNVLKNRLKQECPNFFALRAKI